MTIGVFDSGLGGLSVLHCAMRLAPDCDYVFFADESHVPYGEKSAASVRCYAQEGLRFLYEQGAQVIIIACNTATSVLDTAYREQFPIPLVGMEPAVKTAVEQFGGSGRRILVAATPVTLHGSKLHRLIAAVDSRGCTDLAALPGLVRFAEQGVFEGPDVTAYLEDALRRFDLHAYGTLVLGCTHFNYFKPDFLTVFPAQPHFVDGNAGTVRQAIRRAGGMAVCTGGASVRYWFSGRTPDDGEMERIARCMRRLDAVYDLC